MSQGEAAEQPMEVRSDTKYIRYGIIQVFLTRYPLRSTVDHDSTWAPSDRCVDHDHHDQAQAPKPQQDSRELFLTEHKKKMER